MKTSHILTFIILVLFTSLLCVSFYFVYSGAIQNSYIEQVKIFSQQRRSEFKKAGFYLEESEDPNSIETLNRQHEWIQSNYRSNPMLLSHIYRNPKTNDVIFSNSKDTNFDLIKSEYLRQWSIGFYANSEHKIFSIGSLNMVGVIMEIEDEVLTLGKLELLFDYTPVTAEISKLRAILIVFASSIAVVLFIIFLVVGVRSRKAPSEPLDKVEENAERMEKTSPQSIPETFKKNTEEQPKVETKDDTKERDRIPVINVPASKKLKINRDTLEREVQRDNRSINSNREYVQRHSEYRQDSRDRYKEEKELPVRAKSYDELKDKEGEFLKATASNSRNYVHKVRM